MRDLKALANLDQVDRDLLLAKTTAFFDAIAVQDIERCMAFFHDDAKLNIPGDPSARPFYGNYVGKEAVQKAFFEIGVLFEIIDQQILEMVVELDQVVVHRAVTVRNRGHGPIIRVTQFDFVRYQDGQIIELTGITDVAEVLKHAAP